MPRATTKEKEIERRRKISIALQGRKQPPVSQETRRKMSISAKGNKSNFGNKYTEEAKEKIRKARAKQTFTTETRRKFSEAHKGKKSHFWKGGKTRVSKIIRNSFEYKLWRDAVFQRDNWTCIWCGAKKNLNADHIKRYEDYTGNKAKKL